jgi:putative ABC transport system permease protein
MASAAAVRVAAVMASVLMLSAAGIYAMMSFTVARRRRETGIRTALGADTRRVLAGIFGRAGAQLGAGVAGGLALTMALEFASAGLILGGRGALVLPTVMTIILAVGLLATLGPVLRAFSCSRRKCCATTAGLRS